MLPQLIEISIGEHLVIKEENMENFIMNYDKETGYIGGFYLKSIHVDNIPIPNMEITKEKHQFYMDNNGKYKLNPTTLEDELIPSPEPIQEPKTQDEINSERIDAMESAVMLLMDMSIM